MYTAVNHGKTRVNLTRELGAIVLAGVVAVFAGQRPAAAQMFAFATPSSSGVSLPMGMKVQALGLGARATVATALHGHRLHGYITSIGDQSFEITDVKAWQTYSLAYSDVREISGRAVADPKLPLGNRVLRGVFHETSKLGMGP